MAVKHREDFSKVEHGHQTWRIKLYKEKEFLLQSISRITEGYKYLINVTLIKMITMQAYQLYDCHNKIQEKFLPITFL